MRRLPMALAIICGALVVPVSDVSGAANEPVVIERIATNRLVGFAIPRSAWHVPERPKREAGSYEAYYEDSERPKRHIPLSLQIAFGLISLTGGLFLFDLAFRKQGTRNIGTEGVFPPLAVILIIGGALAIAFAISAP